MQRRLLALSSLFLFALSAFGQGGIINDSVLRADGTPAIGATVRVCTEAASGTPCSPTASIFTDKALTISKTNPVVVDSAAAYTYYAAPGFYKEQICLGATCVTRIVQFSLDANNIQLDVSTTAVAFSATPTFDSSTSVYFRMTLTGNVTSSTLSNAAIGRVVYFNICQDATGGRTFVWPTTVLTPPTVGTAISSCTSASFVYDGTNWREQAASSRGSSVFDTSTTGVLNSRRVVRTGGKFPTILLAHNDCPAVGCIIFIPEPITIPATTLTKPIKYVFGAGSFTVSGTILFQNVRGFIWQGAGASIVPGSAGGTFFLWGGNGTDPMFKLDDVGDSSKFVDFSILASAATPLAAAFNSENGAGSTITPGGRLFENIAIQGTDAGITKGFRWVGTGAGGDNNNSDDTFFKVRVANYVTAAWSFEHSQSKAHRFYTCNFNAGTAGERGIATNQGAGGQGGSFMWYGGGGGNNSVADFSLGPVNDTILISGGNFEGSSRLLETEGPDSNPWAVTIEGVRWASNGLNVDNKAISYSHRGPLNLIGNQLGSDDSKALELFINISNASGTSNAIGNRVDTTLLNPFTEVSGSGWNRIGNMTRGSGVTRMVIDTLHQRLDNTQQFSISSLTELITILAAAFTDTTIQIPADAVVLAVSLRVTVTIPTAATFDIGVSGATTRYGTGIGTAVGTNNTGTDDATRFYSAATSIRITPNLTPADTTGRVRVTIHYYEATPPNS